MSLSILVDNILGLQELHTLQDLREAADVVLMKSDLLDVNRAINLGHKVIGNIKQNLFWAFFYNIIGIPVAAGILYIPFGILLNPMLGAAAMSCSSVSVVSNALRLRWVKF